MIFAAEPNGITCLPPAFSRRVFAKLPDECAAQIGLTEPAEADLLDLVLIANPSTPFPMRLLRQSDKPFVVLIGDDPGTPDGQGGPDAWRCAKRIGPWCDAAIIHAAGAERRHYDAAVAGALMMQRLVLVETTARHASAWHECIGCPSSLLILPRDGVHPVAAEAVH